MSVIERGGNLESIDPLPFNHLYEHIIPQDGLVVVDDYSFEGIDPRRLGLPREAVLLRTIIDIDPHVGGYFIAVAQLDSEDKDGRGVAAYKLTHENNTLVCDGQLTFINSAAVTWFGVDPKIAREQGLPTMQLTGTSEHVSDVHIGLTIDEGTGSLVAEDISENRTWQLSLSPEL